LSYLLDTDILTNLMRERPSVGLVAKLATTPVSEQFTSSISLGELIYGAFKLERRTRLFLDRISILFPADRPVLSFDSAAARTYGEIRAELERRGTPAGDADTRIAAIALVHHLTVVTGNTRHFERFPGLKVENWL